MPRWDVVPPRREGIAESVELAGSTRQALVEDATDVGIIVSLSLLLPAGKTVDDGKVIAERMLVEAGRG